MEKWKINVFTEDFGIEEWAKDLPLVKELERCRGDDSCSEGIRKSFSIYGSLLQRSIIESLIMAEDCDDLEISDLTGVDTDTLLIYRDIFFRVDSAFSSKIDALDYIETNIKTYEEDIDSPHLNLFLLKRWSVSLGKEFIIWKFNLLPVQYSADRLYSVVMKEAFFYHKEKSMGNTEISLVEYLRSTNMLLNSVRASTSMERSTEEDVGLEILDRLDIIVTEEAAPAITMQEMDDGDFVNNANKQETT